MVLYEQVEGAKAARKEMEGRMFEGRRVGVHFVPEQLVNNQRRTT
jgi:hypothetical protein